jgi:hypothetical protein
MCPSKPFPFVETKFAQMDLRVHNKHFSWQIFATLWKKSCDLKKGLVLKKWPKVAIFQEIFFFKSLDLDHRFENIMGFQYFFTFLLDI